MTAYVLEKQRNGLLITLNRPEAMNALSQGLRNEIDALEEAKHDPDTVVITGAQARNRRWGRRKERPMTAYENLLYETPSRGWCLGAGLLITLNRPEAMNALSQGYALRNEIDAALEEASASGPGHPRGVVITGAGRAFSTRRRNGHRRWRHLEDARKDGVGLALRDRPPKARP